MVRILDSLDFLQCYANKVKRQIQTKDSNESLDQSFGVCDLGFLQFLTTLIPTRNYFPFAVLETFNHGFILSCHIRAFITCIQGHYEEE